MKFTIPDLSQHCTVSPHVIENMTQEYRRVLEHNERVRDWNSYKEAYDTTAIDNYKMRLSMEKLVKEFQDAGKEVAKAISINTQARLRNAVLQAKVQLAEEGRILAEARAEKLEGQLGSTKAKLVEINKAGSRFSYEAAIQRSTVTNLCRWLLLSSASVVNLSSERRLRLLARIRRDSFDETVSKFEEADRVLALSEPSITEIRDRPQQVLDSVSRGDIGKGVAAPFMRNTYIPIEPSPQQQWIKVGPENYADYGIKEPKHVFWFGPRFG